MLSVVGLLTGSELLRTGLLSLRGEKAKIYGHLRRGASVPNEIACEVREIGQRCHIFRRAGILCNIH